MDLPRAIRLADSLASFRTCCARHFIGDGRPSYSARSDCMKVVFRNTEVSSMRQNAEANGPSGLPPVITGSLPSKFHRKYRLDELPQLFMFCVGR